MFEKYSCKITATFPSDQWVNDAYWCSDRNVLKHYSGTLSSIWPMPTSESFWVWAQPMRVGLSLAERISRMIPAIALTLLLLLFYLLWWFYQIGGIFPFILLIGHYSDYQQTICHAWVGLETSCKFAVDLIQFGPRSLPGLVRLLDPGMITEESRRSTENPHDIQQAKYIDSRLQNHVFHKQSGRSPKVVALFLLQTLVVIECDYFNCII